MDQMENARHKCSCKSVSWKIYFHITIGNPRDPVFFRICFVSLSDSEPLVKSMRPAQIITKFELFSKPNVDCLTLMNRTHLTNYAHNGIINRPFYGANHFALQSFDVEYQFKKASKPFHQLISKARRRRLRQRPIQSNPMDVLDGFLCPHRHSRNGEVEKKRK